MTTASGSKNPAMGVPQPATGSPFFPLPEFFAVESPQIKIAGLPVTSCAQALPNAQSNSRKMKSRKALMDVSRRTMVRRKIPPRDQTESSQHEQQLEQELPNFECQVKPHQHGDADPHGDGFGYSQRGEKKCQGGHDSD